ncbi:MAG: DUF881 domain-containing protein [Firmicutes bacterium]|jgi:hypothetical protein|nr:DUF881 domain-containing protein [Bacillota bacterium]
MAAKSRTRKSARRLRQWLTGVIILLLFINILVLARAAELITFPGEASDTTLLREGAMALAEYYESQAGRLGLERNTAVREALAKFKFEVSKASDPEAIAYIIGYYGRATGDVMERELENRRREAVLAIINSDPKTLAVTGQAMITVSATQDGRINVEDPARVLSSQAVDMIQKSAALPGLLAPIDIEISGGKANVITPRTMQDRIRLLRDEADSLRLSLDELRRAAGYSSLTGQGILVSLYDAEGGFSKDEVVQEKDIRDIVNELFAAGAQGVEVGGQRLIATSSIRSAGPQVLVNQRPVPVNPVLIRAVGDPEVLESSLDLIRNSLKRWGIRVEVERLASVTLSPYRTQ